MKKICQALFSGLQARRAARLQAQVMAADAYAVRTELLADLAECRRQIQHAESCFDLVTDPAMIESCVYQCRALQARYDALVLQARAQGITAWQMSAAQQQKNRTGWRYGQKKKERCAL